MDDDSMPREVGSNAGLGQDAQQAKSATPHDELLRQLADPRVPKTEREHAAAREIESLRNHIAIQPIRDYFAGQAMAAYIIAAAGNPPEPEQTADEAFFLADAMMAERAKTPGQKALERMAEDAQDDLGLGY